MTVAQKQIKLAPIMGLLKETYNYFDWSERYR